MPSLPPVAAKGQQKQNVEIAFSQNILRGKILHKGLFMDYKKHNIERLVGFFQAGCKAEKLIGLELEHFVVNRDTDESVTYQNGVKQILERFLHVYGEPVYWRENIIGIARGGAHITLEPAAQLEISIGPALGIKSIKKAYDEFATQITPILDEMGYKLVNAGYLPKSRVDDLELLPKKRYEIMDSYFKLSGLMGKNMMKGTAATQISIDYKDEDDFKKKFRVANILGPLFAFICDNTKFFEGQPFQGRMLRTQIWNNVCPARTNLVPGALDDSFGFAKYASYIYDLPSVMVPKNDDFMLTDKVPFSQIFAERVLGDDDIIHATSLAFPDVALKNHIEIRMADSLPIHLALAYTALIKGLFYDEFNLDTLSYMTTGVQAYDVHIAKQELILMGLDGVIYNRPVRDWLKRIFHLAQSGLASDELPYFLPMEAFLP